MTGVEEPAAPAAGPAAPRALVRELAGQLGETAAGPRHQIARVIDALGEERARALLAEALAVEGRGGLLLPDGSRRRTPGGVFFHLVRTQASPEEVRRIFPPRPWSQRRQGTARDAGVSQAPAVPAFTWDDYPAVVAELQHGLGEATSVKITVIGRPAQVLERGDVTIVALRSEKVPSLPKGLPAPAQPTDYAVFIARKQWQKVAQAARNPQDLLIVEGYPTVDPRFAGITVLATQATTKQLQQAQRLREQPPTGGATDRA
ncbi:MAG: phosphorylated adapter RNA export RNA-binding domain-containing protein [Chloroflexota bacterium]|nr:phosphorylated adapter RNA export RNA-binding domain-containing protein [Chloroflexota bacterium]